MNTSPSDGIAAEQAVDWCIRLNEDDCTPEEQEAFNRWINSDPNHAIEYQKTLKVWNLSTQLTPSKPVSYSPRHKNVTPISSTKKNQRSNWHLFARVACVIMLLVPISCYIGWKLDWVPSDYQAYTAEQVRQQFTLPDDSQVELNLNTRLTYTSYRHHRQVNLNHGEAYFHVAHDSSRPFVVSAASGEITVTGTRFNVWKHHDNVVVAVSEGSVSVKSGRSHSKLSSGMQARFNAAYPQPSVSNVDTQQTLAWRDGQLILDNLTLAEATPLINRYLEAPLVLASQSVASLRIGGIYRTDDIQNLINALPDILPVNVSKQTDGSTKISGRYHTRDSVRQSH